MVWRETGIMDERLRFIGSLLEDDETMTDLCVSFGISRKTGYKWLGRYRRVRCGRALRSATSAAAPWPSDGCGTGCADRCCEGSAAVVGPQEADGSAEGNRAPARLPSLSTASAILQRHGLVGRRRSRWKAAGNGPFAQPDGPNAVWTADHKGWFRTRDGWRCEPLTVLDASSRYLLALEATGSTAEAEAWPVFERLFKEYGLPDQLEATTVRRSRSPG